LYARFSPSIASRISWTREGRPRRFEVATGLVEEGYIPKLDPGAEIYWGSTCGGRQRSRGVDG
jgi:hypothetical protein